jgi:1,4-dihydroxy-2-naphthoyl-CoA hydrolase
MGTEAEIAQGGLPGFLGMTVSDRGAQWLEMSLAIQPQHMRPGIPGLHAGTVVTLADTTCGYACMEALPDNARSFITIELKSNLLGTATEGTLVCRAEPEHTGRTTQVWTAVVRHKETDRKIAVFSCTQLVIY